MGTKILRAERRWPGATVVLLASGPSLVSEDVDRCRAYPVIAVNDAHRIAPWAPVLYSSDPDWWAYHKCVPTFQGERWAAGVAKRYVGTNINVLRVTGKEGLELDPSGLRTGKHSGYAAINLAVHFGASRIVLLGYDCGWDGTRSHFFGHHPTSLPNNQLHYGYFRAVMAKLAPLVKAQGIEIVNCSRRTTLTCFPRMELAHALAPLAVSA